MIPSRFPQNEAQINQLAEMIVDTSMHIELDIDEDVQIPVPDLVRHDADSGPDRAIQALVRDVFQYIETHQEQEVTDESLHELSEGVTQFLGGGPDYAAQLFQTLQSMRSRLDQ